MIGAVIASYLFAIVYEGLKTMREWLLYYDIKQFNQEISKSAPMSRGKDRMVLAKDEFKKPKRLVKLTVNSLE